MKEPTQELDDTTLRAGAIYPINFTQPNKRFVLSLSYNKSKSFLFVNATRIYQFKSKKLRNFNPVDTNNVLDIYK